MRSYDWIQNTPQVFRDLLQRYPEHGQVHKFR
jgi:hypothetical protein